MEFDFFTDFIVKDRQTGYSCHLLFSNKNKETTKNKTKI